MLKLIVSRNIDYGIKYIYEKIINNLKSGKISYFFVPDQYTLFSDINLMNSLNMESIVDVKVKSFTSLSSEVLSKYGGIKRNIITDSGKSMLLKSILLRNEESLPSFRKNLNSKGFVSELIDTIKEIKDSGANESILRELVSSENLDEDLKAKLLEISLILNEYNDKISEHYIDGSDRLEILSEKIPEAYELKNIDFFFSYFNDLNAREIEVIEQLYELGVNMTFSLILDPALIDIDRTDMTEDGELFESSFNFYRKLKRITEDIEIIKFNDIKKDEISFLTDNLFSYKPKSNTAVPESIELIRTANTEEEVRFTAEKIKEIVIKDN
ncbi:MAG: hypothetical protein Q4P34_05310 [Tissierellia bacterium]|nr:hypothetical protein [Tissierellia bacterium]